MKKKSRAQPKSKRSTPRRLWAYEAEVLPGLKQFAEAELSSRFERKVIFLQNGQPDQLPFQYAGAIKDLLQLHQVVAIYLVQHFAIPRPRALLGHQNLQAFMAQVKAILGMYPANTFRTFRFSAAGKNSSVFTRIKDEIQQHTRLEYASEEGDLFIRIRPAQLKQGGWEVLLRISPRPLAARAWRVCDMPGALNATVAAAMIELTQPNEQDRFLNLMAGSGTLLIERLHRCPAQVVVGGDHSGEALTKARQNIQAADFQRQVQLVQLDASHAPFPSRRFDVIGADLPWGQLVGSHQQNADLYPKILTEAARLSGPGGRLVLLTHEIKLLEGLLKDYSGFWQLRDAFQVYQGGLHPKIYLFHNRLS